MAEASGHREGFRLFKIAARADLQVTVQEFVTLTHESIVVGSPLTGSPGQPVGQYGPGYHPGEVGGALRDSWLIDWKGPTDADINTDSPYATSIEDAVSYAHGGKPMNLRSTVGGFHSVKTTVAGAQTLMDEAARRHGAR